MNPITATIRRYPMATFWVIAWSTSFFGYAMSILYPSDLWGFFVWGVFLGGALVTGVTAGRSGLKTYFTRIVRWRVGIQWYAVAILLPLVLRLAAFGLNLATGATMTSSFQWPDWGDLIFELIIVFFIIALGEETGFSGFALPRLLATRTALVASLILGVLRMIWHLPLLVSGEEQLTIILIIIAGAVINTWLFVHSNGSVLLVMILHTSVNLWLVFFTPLFSAADAARQETWLAVVYVGMAVLLRLLAGPELGRKPAHSVEAMSADQTILAK